MKKIMLRFACFCLALCLLLPTLPRAEAQSPTVSLSGYIRSRERRHYAESMLSYYLQENMTIRKTLADGYSAVFFFEGCSDNMDDIMLSDLSYYRVSAVCIVVRLNKQGRPEVVYFNDDCSTLPDRPLEYGAWRLEGVGKVGPATVCDGTYELYSVYHAGAYEALHMRTTYENDTIAAIYMTPDGFTPSAANAINIHTRTGNHIIEKAMWSAGCLLVGDGEWIDFANLIVSTYYSRYGRFRVDQKVGCVTINRFLLKDEMYDLYKNKDAVDTLLVASQCELPEIYLQRCTQQQEFEEKTVEATQPTALMSLPCSNSVDARSIPVTQLEQGDRVDICGSTVNTKGQLWYAVSFFGENYYLPAGNVEETRPTLFSQIKDLFRF